ncbi:Intraflagellar transport protein 20 [Clonorchis sinensis]|uniref:Intraflagellar transport protein 20 n=1 Tax=Clonorchis sinensis TaxID=79923 RepID=A0A8T1LY37_CLOSI|nr:Intraflagellar transport protein 20 [Clonorchis sinensis]
MTDKLQEAGLYIDDLNKLRIVDPAVTHDTNELKTECENYLSKVADFQSIVQNLTAMLASVAEQVEKQKLKAIVSRNQLVSAATQRQLEKQQLETEIQKQKDENERLNTRLQSLQKEEADQLEFIERFLMGR